MCSKSSDLLAVSSLEKKIRAKPILRGVSLSVARGQVVGLLGPNGAGKTTTFRIISGLAPADSGDVFLAGQDLRGLPLYRRAQLGLGYLPQEPSVFRSMSVRDNVLLATEAMEDKPTGRDLNEVFERFGLARRLDQKAGTLSGGERRRLELARALIRKPQALLCDEPLTGIDPIAAAEIREILRSLASDGMAVLLTDHNIGEAIKACDLACLIVDGKIVDRGDASQLARSGRAKALYFGESF